MNSIVKVSELCDFKRQFARRLKKRRHILEFSQYELADRAGMSQSALTQIECNRRAPTLETVYRLGVALNIGAKEMFMPIKYEEGYDGLS